MGRRDHPRCTNGIRFEFAKRLSAMTGKEPKEPRKPEALMMPQHSGLSKAPEIWRSSRLPPKSRLLSGDSRLRCGDRVVPKMQDAVSPNAQEVAEQQVDGQPMTSHAGPKVLCTKPEAAPPRPLRQSKTAEVEYLAGTFRTRTARPTPRQCPPCRA